MIKVEKKAKEELYPYDYTTQEWLLVAWYQELVESGDMYVTFASDMRYLSNFLQFFRGRVTLGYSADERGIWFALWVEPMMSGAYWGVWIRKDKRHTVSAFKALAFGIDEALKYFTCIIGICKQEHLRDIHLKLGFKKLGVIPALWDGEDVDAYVLTRDGWTNRKEQRQQ
jgi:hypothetical protein